MHYNSLKTMQISQKKTFKNQFKLFKTSFTNLEKIVEKKNTPS